MFRSKKGYEGHLETRHSNNVNRKSSRRRGENNKSDRRDEKTEAELVEAIIRRVREECQATGSDVNRKGYVKHFN